MDQLTYVDKDFDFHIVLKDMHRDAIISGKEKVPENRRMETGLHSRDTESNPQTLSYSK